MLSWQDGRGLPLQVRELVHVIIERCEFPLPCIAQDRVEPALFGLAGKKRNTERLRFAHVRRHFRQHGDALKCGSRRYRPAARPQGTDARDRQRVEIVGLHANKTDQRLAARLADLFQ